jgi:multiple sugar transport system substrate-binding protein
MATSISRRRFLAAAAAVTGAAAGTASGLGSAVMPRVEAAAERASITLTAMYPPNELSDLQIKIFEQQNPGIKVTRIVPSPVRLSAMLAAGQPPDFLRVVSTDVPSYAARGVALDLDSNFKASKVLSAANLLSSNDGFRWDGSVQGKGPRYGMAKDFSLDSQMWYSKTLFDRAGVKYPSATTPLHYDELLALAKKLTVRRGSRIQVYGLDIGWDLQWAIYGQIVWMLAQEGKSLWNHDFTEADFTSPEARKVLKWFVDWAQAHVGPSPLDPGATWGGGLFEANRTAMIMYGYWFEGEVLLDTPPLLPHMGFLPSPQWGSKPSSANFLTTGAIIPKSSKNKDAAWTFFEYFFAGRPALDRATSGFGLPTLKSYLKDVPLQTPQKRQIYTVFQNDLKHEVQLQYSPYITQVGISTALTNALIPMMKGEVSLDAGAGQLETAVNKLLRLGKEQAS